MSDAERVPQASVGSSEAGLLPPFSLQETEAGRGGVGSCQRHGTQGPLHKTWGPVQNEMQPPGSAWMKNFWC